MLWLVFSGPALDRRICRSKRQSMKTLMTAWGAVVSLAIMTNTAMAYDEPRYALLLESDDFEIRRYPSYVVAEVTVAADIEDAGNAAFGPLVGFIGGSNEQRRKISMTAPVTQVAEESALGQGTRKQVVQFIMPAAMTEASTPRPNDSQVRLRTIPDRVVAVRRYSGRWTESSLREEEAALREALARQGVKPIGPMEWARFNSPFSLPFLRRNEVWIPVAFDGE